jgi:hypothetical protein
MPVTLVNTWSGTYAPSGVDTFVFPSPSLVNQILFINSADGHWLIAAVSWTLLSSAQPGTVSVSDDAHNLWYPLGPALQTSLCSVALWAAPAARPVDAVYVAPSAGATCRSLIVQEYSGLGNGFAITGYAAGTATTSAGATVTLGALSQSSLVITAGVYDNATFAAPITVTGTGWTNGTTVAYTSGIGYGFDNVAGIASQVTSGATSATWKPTGSTGTGLIDVTAVIAGVAAAQSPPAQLSANWPAVQLQAALGTTTGGPAGQATPPDQAIWVDMSGRLLSWDETRGGQYELDKLEASEVNVLIDNHDGAFTPRAPWAITATGTGTTTTIPVSTVDAGKVTVTDFFQLYTSAGAVLQAAVFQVTAVNTVTGVVTFTPAAATAPVATNVAQSGTLTPIQVGQVTSYVPVRLLTTWNGRTQISYAGFTERWPQEWSAGAWWQESHAVFTDLWSVMNAVLKPIDQVETINDGPFAFWPCDDGAGSNAAANLAPANTDQLPVKQSKSGPGNATFTFGATPGSGFTGKSVWQQSGLATNWDFVANVGSVSPNYIGASTALPANIAVGNHFQLYNASAQLKEPTTFVVTQLQTGTNNFILFSPNAQANPVSTDQAVSFGDQGYGYCLFYQPSAGPQSLTGGLTVNMWFNVVTPANSQGAQNTLWTMSHTGGPMVSLWLAGSLQTSPGTMHITVYDQTTGAATPTQIGSLTWAGFGWHMVTVWLTPTTWQVIIDAGGLTGSTSGAANLAPAWGWIEFGGISDAYTSGLAFNGELADISIFSYRVPFQRLLNQYAAASAAMASAPGSNQSFDTVSDRIHRYLQAGGYRGPKAIDNTGNTYGQRDTTAATEISGKQASAAIQDMTESDGGLLYIAGDGNIVYEATGTFSNEAPAWVLGENTTAGEIPYLADARVGYDPTLIANTITATQQNGPAVTPSNELIPFITASQARFGTITNSPTVYLADGQAVTDLVNWIAETNGTAHLRVEQVTVDAAKVTAAWPLHLYGDVGDVVLFRRRPVTGGAPPLTISCIILKLKRTLDWATGTATLQLTLSPYLGTLATNSATFGLPNGTVILGK